MLGFAYVKFAGTAPAPPGYQEADLDKTQLSGTLQAAGVGQPGHAAGSIPANTGTLSGMQLLPAAVSDLAGQESGALVQAFLPLISKLLPPNVAEALMKQRRVAAGAGTVAESQQIAAALGSANTRLMARHAEMLSSTLRNLAGAAELPASWKPAIAWAASKAGDPAYTGAVGGVVAALRGADIPIISPLLNQALHDTPTSYMPIVQATMLENNGILDERLVQARIAEFEDNQNKGLYTDREGNPMDANVAISSFGLAAQSLGGRATPLQRAELARLADSVMKHKLASTPAAAYAIVQQMGVQKALQDPAGFDVKIAQLGARLQRLSPTGGNSTTVALGALEMAAKTGMPLEHTLERVISQGERQRVWEQSGKTPQQLAQLQSLDQAVDATRTKGFAEADSMKGLAAWVAQTGQGRKAFSDFIAAPTAEKSARMFAAARHAPTWKDRGAFDSSILRGDLGPNEMSALQMGEQQAFAQELSGGRNSPLSRIMRDPNKYRTMLEDPLAMTEGQRRELASLPYYVKKHLSNQGVRGVAVDYLANQDAASLPLPKSQLPAYKSLAPPPTTQKPGDDRPRTP